MDTKPLVDMENFQHLVNSDKKALLADLSDCCKAQTGEVVGCILLAGNQLLWVEELTLTHRVPFSDGQIRTRKGTQQLGKVAP